MGNAEPFFQIKEIKRYLNSRFRDRKTELDVKENGNYHFYLFLRGSLEIKNQSGVYKLFEQSFIIYKPEGVQELYSTPNSDYVHCVFSGECAQEILNNLDLYCNIIYPLIFSYKTPDSYLKYNRKIDYIISESNKNEQYSETVIPCMFIEFLALCSRNIASEDDVRNIRAIKEVIAYIRDNIHKEIDINTLCEISHLSKSRLHTVFKKHTGTSPIKFQNTHRLTAAADFLSVYNMKIKDVSEYLGYQDPLYFSKLFKKHFGVSPSEYVKLKKIESDKRKKS